MIGQSRGAWYEGRGRALERLHKEVRRRHSLGERSRVSRTIFSLLLGLL